MLCYTKPSPLHNFVFVRLFLPTLKLSFVACFPPIVFLDLPAPWEAVASAKEALRVSVSLVAAMLCTCGCALWATITGRKLASMANLFDRKTASAAFAVLALVSSRFCGQSQP